MSQHTTDVGGIKYFPSVTCVYNDMFAMCLGYETFYLCPDWGTKVGSRGKCRGTKHFRGENKNIRI